MKRQTLLLTALALLLLGTPALAQVEEPTNVVNDRFSSVSYTHLTLPTILRV